ncbi:MAG TPA: FAD:protein FMN transferase [Myxococcota bacterium]|nr:FAD:protein FMN transferase [Myxococcota bacterium]
MLGRYSFRAMGSPCELHLYGATRDAIDATAAEARALIERLEQKYSRYRADSALSALNRSAGDPKGVEVDDETALLLDYAATAHAESGGLFDPTSGSLRRVWDLRSGRVPAQAEIDAQLERVGWHKARWEKPRFAMPVAGMELDFGGFVKEYAVDLVADLCRARGVHHGMVDLGGDLHAIGPHPNGKPWLVGIRDPDHPERAIASVALFRGALATSGDYERCMVVDGVRYTHILDPHTGWPVSGGLRSASAIADRCLVAGTATTIALLKGARAGCRFLDSLGLASLRVTAGGRVSGSLAKSPRASAESSGRSAARARRGLER